jgi:hypothetical protein
MAWSWDDCLFEEDWFEEDWVEEDWFEEEWKRKWLRQGVGWGNIYRVREHVKSPAKLARRLLPYHLVVESTNQTLIFVG